MTYTEREIARLEGMKDGLIKKLVEECEDINDQIIALRKGTPRKKDSEIYFDRGYAKGRADAKQEIYEIMSEDIASISILYRIDKWIKEQNQ